MNRFKIARERDARTQTVQLVRQVLATKLSRDVVTVKLEGGHVRV
jgi:hypothetical protein